MIEPEVPQTVLEHLLNSIPAAFFEHLAARQSFVYEEVRESVNDPRYTPVEGRYLAGYLRRSLMENLFRQAANASGLKWQDVMHPQGRFSCVHIYAANFHLTTHYVSNPGDFVRPCASRQQDASVNKFLDGYYLRGSLLAPLPTLESARAIQLYLLHGKRFINTESLFINLALPDSELSKYQWQRTLPEIQQAYLEKFRQNTAVSNATAEPKPQIKRQKKEVAS